jgi:GNAT superfamily N-acetyltransferase
LRTLAAGLAARLAVDRWTAGSVEELPEGTLLRTPAWRVSWDLNQLVLRPGSAGFDASRLDPDTMRVTIPEPAGPIGVPDGWGAEESLAMVFEGDRPPWPWPAGVERTTGEALHETRLALWRAWLSSEEDALALAEMQRHFTTFPGALCVAVREGDAWIGWAQVANGCIDDVWVGEPFRGRGLGRALTQAAVCAGGWFLTTDARDPRPQGLYRSLGFRAVGRVVQLTRR